MATVMQELVTIIGYEVDEGGMEEYKTLLDDTSRSLKLWAVAGWAAVAAGGALVTITAQSTAAAFRLSQRQGTNFQDQQRLGHAAELTGSSTESMTAALGALDKMAAQVKLGNVNEGLIRLGISAGQLLGGVDIFLKVADAISEMEEAGEKAAFVGLIGIPADLVTLLGKGSEEILRLGFGLDKLGGVVGPELAAESVRMAENLTKIGAAGEGIGKRLSEKLLPVLNDIAEAMVTWVEANQELLDSEIGGFGDGLVSNLQPLLIFLTLLSGAAALLVTSLLGLPAAATFAGVGLLLIATKVIDRIIEKWDELTEAFSDPPAFLKGIGDRIGGFFSFGAGDSASLGAFGPAASSSNTVVGPSLTQNNTINVTTPDTGGAATAFARILEDWTREAGETMSVPAT